MLLRAPCLSDRRLNLFVIATPNEGVEAPDQLWEVVAIKSIPPLQRVSRCLLEWLQVMLLHVLRRAIDHAWHQWSSGYDVSLTR